MVRGLELHRTCLGQNERLACRGQEAVGTVSGVQSGEQRDGGSADQAQLAYLDQALWKRFREADGTLEFSAAWLTLQCSMLSGARAGVVVLRGVDQTSYAPVAKWPDGAAVSAELSSAAESALGAAQGVVNQSQGFACAAFPLSIDGDVRGVAGVEVVGHDGTSLRSLMRQLQWGCGWLEATLRKQVNSLSAEDDSDAALAIELAALVLEAERFQEAATAVVTELATRLGCDRVALGIRERKHCKVVALSHSAQFGKHSNLTRAIGATMDEALDQNGLLCFPQEEDAKVRVDRAHAELAEIGGGRFICTVPLQPGGDPFGAITFDKRQRPFDVAELASIDRVAAFLGPVLATRYREDRWIGWKIGQSLKTQLGRLLGARYVGRKLLVLGLASVIAFFALAQDMWRIQADATLEGAVERVTVAPIAGYVIESKVRAGDLVNEGDLLFRIDDRDLRLEYLKWSSQKEQVQRKLRDALAQHERSEVNVLRSQLDQAEAQLTLVGEQIARTRVVAPFDGVVVSGDLSDQLGAPVERGQVLFEIAPLDRYRVALQVDETEIGAVAVAQEGQLVLASMPHEVLAIRIDGITPVSNPVGGRNTFRVEASMIDPPGFLRPGMQGKARIAVEERNLAWIWTHDLFSWLRLWFWSWWP